jgi:hypothetical protein
VAAVGPQLAPFTRVGKLQRGVLEVVVANSTVLQELTFAQADILAQLALREASAAVRKLRFRTGQIG